MDASLIPAMASVINTAVNITEPTRTETELIYKDSELTLAFKTNDKQVGRILSKAVEKRLEKIEIK